MTSGTSLALADQESNSAWLYDVGQHALGRLFQEDVKLGGSSTSAVMRQFTYELYGRSDTNGRLLVHAGVDYVPCNQNGTDDRTASALSVSDGTVVRVGPASGFGQHTVVVRNAMATTWCMATYRRQT